MAQVRIKTLLIFIKNWKISRPSLAMKCGIRINTFNNKLAERPGYGFTQDELNKLIEVLTKMCDQYKKVLDGISIAAEQSLPIPEMPRRNKSKDPRKIVATGNGDEVISENPEKEITKLPKRKYQDPFDHPDDILNTAPVQKAARTNSNNPQVIPRGYRDYGRVGKDDLYDFDG